ncbi:hypothetical protein F8M41_002042 [Gigaspora margarita]|uniref:Ankyrin repeat protein n=1 Tax=Gigaspora margarita TaxID=4874 RepID=A0A8H4A7M6_GIGMA|nr:hypothetical protein F8M41_002042 [Gigaspora margarita]
MSASIHVAALEEMNATDEAYWTTLHIAMSTGNLAVTESANLNLRDQNNQTPLHRRVVRGYYHCLCSRNVTPNVVNKVKNTPLCIWYVKKGSVIVH